MKTLTICFSLLFSLSLLAQEKGVSPVSTVGSDGTGATYAVVVGISDYQDEGIPDLRFADKDAEAFANYLRSPAGGSLAEDNLQVLVNEKATTGQLVAAMDWLVEACSENDRAVIYFSGHGDVEKKSAFNLGFLLTWDSPPKAYMAGAYPIYYLKAMVSTLSTQNKAKVLLITDACRSGKLAGNDIGGNQVANSNLSEQFANETKILSCQPNEFSIEGEQWGGGRGAFSYHLIDGLIGMADDNADNDVSLKEIGRYLEDRVTEEVAPQSQNPMIIGDKTEKLTDVFQELLAQVEKGKKGQMALFASTETRGMEEDVLAAVDSVTRDKYLLFKKSLKEKVFLEPTDRCADSYYSELVKEPKLKRLHAAIRRNYAAALQDDAQQVLNKILNNDVNEMSLSKVNKTEKYRLYPAYLQKAAELLGSSHYMYPVLSARKLYFEGYLLHAENKNADRALGEKALTKYREALILQPDFPHPYYSMAAAHFWQMEQLDSAEYYTELAVDLAPSWFVPYTALASMYFKTGNFSYHDKSKHFLELADRVDSTASFTNIWHMFQWSEYYIRNHKFSEGADILKKIIQLDDQFAIVYRGLGTVYYNTYRYDDAIANFKKAIEMDSTDTESMTYMGSTYYYQKNYEKAEESLLESLQLENSSTGALTGLGMVYLDTDRKEKADQIFRKALALAGPKTCMPCLYVQIGNAYVQSGSFKKAEELLLKGIQLDTNNFMVNLSLGNIYTTTGNYDKGEKFLLKTLQIDSNNVYTKNMLGWIYFKNNQFEKAEKQILDLLSIDSIHNDGLICLAIFMGQTERYEQGEAIALKSIKLHPHDPHGPNTLGLIYAKSGRFEEADQQLKKSLKMAPDDNNNAPSVYIHYAVLHSMQNNIDKAFEYLEQAGKMEHLSAYFYIDLQTEPSLAPLREHKGRWNALMKKYFPDQVKD